MRMNMMLRMVALLSLMLLAPRWLCAEAAPCPVDTPRAKEIWANAPQTPEALLRVLKAFMDNPKMNGFEFGERVFGLAREAWGAPFGVYAGDGRGSKKQIEYTPFLRGGGQTEPPFKPLPTATPYHMGEGYINLNENNDLLGVKIRGFKEGFCVTPTLMRRILGVPKGVTDGGNFLYVAYSWDKYGISVVFPDLNNRDYRPDGDPKRKNKLITDATSIDAAFTQYQKVCAQDFFVGQK